MKGHVDKSIGIVTLMSEALTKINPTVPLRVVKRSALTLCLFMIRGRSRSKENIYGWVSVYVYYESIKRELKKRLII